jgi:hypothetical protein
MNMRRPALRITVACLTFAVGTAAALGWYVHSRPEVVPDESPAEREAKRTFQEGLKAEVPFRALVDYPKVYENRLLRVGMSYYSGAVGQDFFGVVPHGAKDSIWIEYESEQASAEAERIFKEIDQRMDNCWLGVGNTVGRFEGSEGEGYGPQKSLPYRFVISHVEHPQVVLYGGQE